MIISHKHRYLFIEIPLTASYAVRHELCEYYDGVPILHKHATYPEFRRNATADERDYFVFATVRNPLDKIVSRYFRRKTDHKGAFSDPESLRSLRTDYADHRKYEFVRDSSATFEHFFRKYHRRPYGDLIDIASRELDFVMRYERLQDHFSELLRILAIGQVRPVPVINKTRGKGDDWESYYTPDIIEQAKRACGPFMKKWGYAFPPGWGDYHVSWIDQVEYQLVNMVRILYLTRFRYNDRAYARVVRLLRAYLIE